MRPRYGSFNAGTLQHTSSAFNPAESGLHTLLVSMTAKPPSTNSTLPSCQNMCCDTLLVRLVPSVPRNCRAVRTPSAIRPKKPTAIKVGCQENRVLFKAMTGTETAKNRHSTWTS